MSAARAVAVMAVGGLEGAMVVEEMAGEAMAAATEAAVTAAVATVAAMVEVTEVVVMVAAMAECLTPHQRSSARRVSRMPRDNC